MQLKGERMGRSTTKAFVTSWDNVAPPLSKFKNNDISCLVQCASCLVRHDGRPWHGLGLPITEKIHDTIISLPISPVMTEDEVGAVIAAVNAWTMG